MRYLTGIVLFACFLVAACTVIVEGPNGTTVAVGVYPVECPPTLPGPKVKVKFKTSPGGETIEGEVVGEGIVKGPDGTCWKVQGGVKFRAPLPDGVHIETKPHDELFGHMHIDKLSPPDAETTFTFVEESAPKILSATIDTTQAQVWVLTNGATGSLGEMVVSAPEWWVSNTNILESVDVVVKNDHGQRTFVMSGSTEDLLKVLVESGVQEMKATFKMSVDGATSAAQTFTIYVDGAQVTLDGAGVPAGTVINLK